MCGVPSDPVYVTDYGCLGEVGLEDAERKVGALFLLCLAGTVDSVNNMAFSRKDCMMLG